MKTVAFSYALAIAAMLAIAISSADAINLSSIFRSTAPKPGAVIDNSAGKYVTKFSKPGEVQLDRYGKPVKVEEKKSKVIAHIAGGTALSALTGTAVYTAYSNNKFEKEQANNKTAAAEAAGSSSSSTLDDSSSGDYSEPLTGLEGLDPSKESDVYTFPQSGASSSSSSAFSGNVDASTAAAPGSSSQTMSQRPQIKDYTTRQGADSSSTATAPETEGSTAPYLGQGSANLSSAASSASSTEDDYLPYQSDWSGSSFSSSTEDEYTPEQSGSSGVTRRSSTAPKQQQQQQQPAAAAEADAMYYYKEGYAAGLRAQIMAV